MHRTRTIATVPLPFHQGTTEPIAQALRKANIHTYIASRGSLRESLVCPKDKLPHMKSSGNVYHAACAGKEGEPCPARYIGETERSMDTHFHEHHSNVKLPNSDMYSSAIRQHIDKSDHCFLTEDVSFLDSNANWHARGIKEAAYVRSFQPSLNRDGGRHELPIYMMTSSRPTLAMPVQPQLTIQSQDPGYPQPPTYPELPGQTVNQPWEQAYPCSLSTPATPWKTAWTEGPGPHSTRSDWEHHTSNMAHIPSPHHCAPGHLRIHPQDNSCFPTLTQVLTPGRPLQDPHDDKIPSQGKQCKGLETPISVTSPNL
jgi:hypothetical protein